MCNLELSNVRFSAIEKLLIKSCASLGQLIAPLPTLSAGKSTYERHRYQPSVSKD